MYRETWHKNCPQNVPNVPLLLVALNFFNHAQILNTNIVQLCIEHCKNLSCVLGEFSQTASIWAVAKRSLRFLGMFVYQEMKDTEVVLMQ